MATSIKTVKTTDNPKDDMAKNDDTSYEALLAQQAKLAEEAAAIAEKIAAARGSKLEGLAKGFVEACQAAQFGPAEVYLALADLDFAPAVAAVVPAKAARKRAAKGDGDGAEKKPRSTKKDAGKAYIDGVVYRNPEGADGDDYCPPRIGAKPAWLKKLGVDDKTKTLEERKAIFASCAVA